MCFLCSSFNQLCTSISKSAATISQTKGLKNNFTICKRERVIAISEHEDTILMYLNSLYWPKMFPTLSFFSWILHGISIVHFILWLVSNMFLFFIVVTPSIITTHWSLVFYEISFYHVMPKCDVMFIVKTNWHCSLF